MNPNDTLLIQFLQAEMGKQSVYTYANDLQPDLTSLLAGLLVISLGAQKAVCVFSMEAMQRPEPAVPGPKEDTHSSDWNAHRGHTRTQNLH